jgi:hypothetical protein
MPTEKVRNKSTTTRAKRFSHDPASEVLSAYEQLGRIDILEGGLAGSPFVDVNLLANLAQQQLDSGNAGNAAILLRAAEHISFAALEPRKSAELTARIPEELKAAVASELGRITQGARQLWSETEDAAGRGVIEKIFTGVLEQAGAALTCGAYRPALQLARAAEELAHVAQGLPATLPGDRELRHRLAS